MPSKGSRSEKPCKRCGNPSFSRDWYRYAGRGRVCARCAQARSEKQYERDEAKPAYVFLMPTPEQEAASRAERDAAWEARNEEGRQREAKKRELENARAYRLLPEG